MSATQSIDKFAFGENERDGCECPALAAGLNPVKNDIPGLFEAAEWYDDVAEGHESEWIGIVSESEAKKYWLEMLEDARERNNIAVNAAEKVAAYHGWV